MEPKLILVEGLPGAGKTTVARKLKKQLEEQGRSVKYYEVKGRHPTDMAWQAYLTKEEYHQFIAECLNLWMMSKQSISDDELIRRIEEQSWCEGGHVTMAYQKIHFPEDIYGKLTKKLVDKEINRGKVSFEQYRKIHLEKWNKFGQDMMVKNETAIFESSFLQDHIFEILCSYELSDIKIVDYIMELAEAVKYLNPWIAYVRTENIGTLISNTARERANPVDSEKDWFSQIEQWTRNTKFGMKNHLSGRKGVLRLLEERQRLDYLLLDKVGLPVKKFVLEKTDKIVGLELAP